MDLIANFPKNHWADYLTANKPVFQFDTGSKRRTAVKDLVDQAIDEIDKFRFGKALDRIVLALYLDSLYGFAVLKREGVFRHSSYLDNRNPIGGFVDHLLKNKVLLGFASKDINYLETIRTMDFVHALLKELRKSVVSELGKFKQTEIIQVKGGKYRKSRLKALLSINERVFLYNMIGEKEHKDATSLKFYSKEEISEAISFLLASYNKQFSIEQMDVYFIDDQYAKSPQAENLILFACLYKNVQDIEILVESFGYVVSEKGGTLIFECPDKNFAQSLDMSNIMQELQTQTNNFWIFKHNPEALSLFDLAEEYHKRFPDYFKLETDPFPRYVLKIPMPLFEYFLSKKDMSFFKEELIIATDIQSELLLDIKDLKDYEIAEGLTFYDFFKLLRLFIIKAYLLHEKMITLQSDGERNIAHNSFPALYKVEDLKVLLQSLAPEKAIEQFLKMLSWDVSEKDSFLDLQYQPLVRIGDYYLVQSIILASSNIPRSIFLSENKRGNNFKARQFFRHRSLAKIMSEAFTGKGFLCKSEVQVKYDSGLKKHGDIDFLAYKEGLLFIAECKDSTYPTDFFELRTTHDYVQKASEQIAHILAALADPAYQKIFEQQTGIKANEIKNVVPTIVLSNRKFWGYSINGIPVRSLKEMIAFVIRGMWNFKLPDGDLYKFRLWKENEFQPADLLLFCGIENPHDKIRKAMKEYEATLAPKVIQKRYSLNLIEVVDIMKAHFPYETVAADKI